jgi:archaellum component FlaF (FlaF/FlaG flagellin family)
MKGISEVIAGILIVAMAIGLMSVFYMFYSSSTQTAMENAEAQEKVQNCERNANILIEGINGSMISIKNNGATNINTSHFSGYLNGVPIQIEATNTLLRPGDEINFSLNQAPTLGNRVKIMGDCNSGDEFYVK